MAGKNRPLAGQARPIPGQSVVERIHAQAHFQPGRIALASPAGGQTFGQCWSRARGIAAALADSGVVPGERIAVCQAVLAAGARLPEVKIT